MTQISPTATEQWMVWKKEVAKGQAARVSVSWGELTRAQLPGEGLHRAWHSRTPRAVADWVCRPRPGDPAFIIASDVV